MEGFPVMVPPPVMGHQRLALRLRDLLRDMVEHDQEVVLTLRDATYAVVDEGPAVVVDGLSLDLR